MSNRILSIDLSRLSNVTYIRLMTYVETFVNRLGAETLGFALQYGNFIPLLADAREALEAEHSNPRIQAKNVADEVRDNAYRVFYYMVKAYTFSDDATLNDAAHQVMRVLKDDANPLQATPEDESVLLTNIISRLNTPSYAGFLSALQTQALLNKVETTNKEYIRLSEECIEEKSAHKSIDIRAIRKKINPVYRDIVAVANSFASVQPNNTALSEFVNLLNAEISTLNTALAQKKTKAESAKTAEAAKTADNASTPNP